MQTQDFKFERLSQAEMSQLSNQEMAVALGGYIYEAPVFIRWGDTWYVQDFYFDSEYNYREQYIDFAHIFLEDLIGYGSV